MATDDEGFERWVAEEGGPKAVAEMLADLRRDVEAGRVPGFADKDEFLAYIQSPDRRSA
jgi:antibiotic biosynthesis monooxygenase (ABM) superfamily enzyme